MLHKAIVLADDLAKWTESSSYSALVDFLQSLQNAVVGLPNEAKVPVLDTCQKLHDVLSRADSAIDNNPVAQDAAVSRFGKVELRAFYDHVKAHSVAWLADIAPHADDSHIQELAGYFSESWGNRTRIDYGSGHELNFVAFLYCLCGPLGVLEASDHAALVLKVFTRYMSIMRRLQTIYWLEPAGSHGVWGLDDYHFLPFLFGAAQLATHAHMKPTLVHNRELVECYWKKYMYLECVNFINSIKTVPGRCADEVSLRWYLPMLDDILAAKSWQKISDGMIKMYKAEVLGKLPIVQHFLFGELIPKPVGTHDSEHGAGDADDCCGPAHRNTWADCCGIAIPSAIAASQSRLGVPFD